jgi:hypothetical protein
MASTFSNLGLNLQATGENSGTWGSITNVNLQDIDNAISGVYNLTVTGSTTLAFTTNSSSTTFTDEAGRNKTIILSGSLTSTTITITVPNIEKDYYIINNSGATAVISSGGSTTVSIVTGSKNIVVVNASATSVLSALPADQVNSPGGTTNAVQYNSSGSFAGSTNFTFDGTTVGMQTATALNLTVTTLSATNLTAVTSTVTTANLATANITTANIVTANVTTANIITANVTTANIITANITTANVTSLTYTNATGTTANLVTANIATANVTTLKFNTATGIYDNNSNPELIFTVAASATNYLTIANSSTANNPSISATGSDANVGINFSPKGLGKVTLAGTGKIQATAELVSVYATAANSTVNYYVSNQAVMLYTTAATANWVLNIAGNATTTLNNFLNTNESLTVAHLVNCGSTAYYATSIQVDGTTTGVTTKWQGGTAPTSGNASSIDSYNITVIKTAATTYTVLAAQTKFA